MNHLFLDFETASDLDINKVGLHNYCTHPSTKALLLGYAVDNNDVQVRILEPGETLPDNILVPLLDPTVIKVAWNSEFERNILKYVLGIDIPIEQWIDPAAIARYYALPANLEDAAIALHVTHKKAGAHLIRMFSLPQKSTKKQIAAGAPATYWKDATTDPLDWTEFCFYCQADVIAEREVFHKLMTFTPPMPESEFAAWRMTNRINEYGVLLDREFITNANVIAIAEATRIIGEMKTLTGLENPNSRKQLMSWLTPHGYLDSCKGAYSKSKKKKCTGSVDKLHVHKQILRTDISDELRRVLTLKEELGGSAYKKLGTMLALVSADGRLRNELFYYGAHTGRWSCRGVQLHNFALPLKPVSKRYDEFVAMIKAGTYEPDPTLRTMSVISGTLKAAFIASPGHKLVVGDLSQIEARVNASLAGCKLLLDDFENDLDVYTLCQARTTRTTEQQVKDDATGRAKGKQKHLALGYAMGAQNYVDNAEKAGLIISLRQAKIDVEAWRRVYHEIPALWDRLENACKRAVTNHEKLDNGFLVIDGRDSSLKITLSSGRTLHYPNARFVMMDKGYGRGKERLLAYDSYADGQVQIETVYGGKLSAHIVSSTSRDIMLNGMILAEQMGFKILTTVHDEIVSEVPIDSPLGVTDLLRCMSTMPAWYPANRRLILGAEGYDDMYYRKSARARQEVKYRNWESKLVIDSIKDKHEVN